MEIGVQLPEFPTGNGKIDLIIQYQGKTYGIEIKSFTHHAGYQQALPRTAKYGHQLGLEEIYLVSFLDRIDEKTREIYETYYHDPETSVTVKPIFTSIFKKIFFNSQVKKFNLHPGKVLFA